VTYTVDGEQFVVVLAGWGGAQVALAPEPGAAVNKYGNNGKIFAFRIGGQKTVEATENPAPVMAKPLEVTASAAVVAKGNQLYDRVCSLCHGALVMSGGILPDLRYSTPETFARYKEIVIDGERASTGMASFADALSVEDVEAIKAYVLAVANQTYAAQAAAAPPAQPAPAATPPQ
jgi:mono/diheme cytochrome c family protein